MSQHHQQPQDQEHRQQERKSVGHLSVSSSSREEDDCDNDDDILDIRSSLMLSEELSTIKEGSGLINDTNNDDDDDLTLSSTESSSIIHYSKSTTSFNVDDNNKSIGVRGNNSNSMLITSQVIQEVEHESSSFSTGKQSKIIKSLSSAGNHNRTSGTAIPFIIDDDIYKEEEPLDNDIIIEDEKNQKYNDFSDVIQSFLVNNQDQFKNKNDRFHDDSSTITSMQSTFRTNKLKPLMYFQCAGYRKEVKDKKLINNSNINNIIKSKEDSINNNNISNSESSRHIGGGDIEEGYFLSKDDTQKLIKPIEENKNIAGMAQQSHDNKRTSSTSQAPTMLLSTTEEHSSSTIEKLKRPPLEGKKSLSNIVRGEGCEEEIVADKRNTQVRNFRIVIICLIIVAVFNSLVNHVFKSPSLSPGTNRVFDIDDVTDSIITQNDTTINNVTAGIIISNSTGSSTNTSTSDNETAGIIIYDSINGDETAGTIIFSSTLNPTNNSTYDDDTAGTIKCSTLNPTNNITNDGESYPLDSEDINEEDIGEGHFLLEDDIITNVDERERETF